MDYEWKAEKDYGRREQGYSQPFFSGKKWESQDKNGQKLASIYKKEEKLLFFLNNQIYELICNPSNEIVAAILGVYIQKYIMVCQKVLLTMLVVTLITTAMKKQTAWKEQNLLAIRHNYYLDYEPDWPSSTKPILSLF